jgi:hypothetical protein
MLARLEHPAGEPAQEKGQPFALGCTVWKGNRDHGSILPDL